MRGKTSSGDEWEPPVKWEGEKRGSPGSQMSSVGRVKPRAGRNDEFQFIKDEVTVAQSFLLPLSSTKKYQKLFSLWTPSLLPFF